MNLKKVIIYTSEPFPQGMAATNRIISYAKGFLHNKKDVQIICFRKTDNYLQVVNKKIEGSYEGIPYKYLYQETFRSKTFIKRRLDNFSGYTKLFLFAINNNSKSTLSIYYSSFSLPAIILFLVKVIKGSVLLKEESEHPSVYLKEKRGISKLFFKHIHYRLFNGYLLMTNHLMNLFKEMSPKNKPMLLVPMTIDSDRFLNLSKKENNKSIIYTGIIDCKKDGLDILIEAFGIISKKYPEYKLELYGSASSASEQLKLNKLVSQLNLDNKVIFHGQVNREIISQKILDAKILILPRPNSIQAQNGFPTKLGEYLATGNPVIATSVGEIPLYLTNNVNSFLVKPGNINELSDKINYVIENYTHAKLISKKGQELTKSVFNNIIQTEKINIFFEETFYKIA